MSEEKKESHDSYAVISLTKTKVNTALFGSKVENQNAIRIEICKAKVYNDSNYVEEKIFRTTDTIVEVLLSQLQFSELITSMNHQSGVPCTVIQIDNKRIENPPIIKTVKEKGDEYLKERLDKFQQNIISTQAKIDEILNKSGNLTKSDKEEIKSFTNWIKRETLSNIPFYQTIVKEYVEEAVLEAKLDFEAHTNNVVHNLGLQALAKQMESNENALLLNNFNININPDNDES